MTAYMDDSVFVLKIIKLSKFKERKKIQIKFTTDAHACGSSMIKGLPQDKEA